MKASKEILLQANIEGDKNANMDWQLFESKDEGIQLLLSILNQPNGKLLLLNY